MLDKLHVRPAAGMRVRMPDQGFNPVPENGCRVDPLPFYTRAINRGELILMKDERKVTEKGIK